MTPGLLQRLAEAESIALEAGRILLWHHGRLAGYDEKSAINLVSVADRESEAAIAERLAAAFPQDVLVREELDGLEGAKSRREEIESAEHAWLIDPLDGTTSFVHGYPAFCVSLGLLHHGRPVLGVVHSPPRGETFVGGTDIPARRNGDPIRVSSTPSLSRALLGTGFPYDRRHHVDELLRVLRSALLVAHDVRRSGSAALDLCDVAAGRLDGFFEQGLAPWDLAAGRAIIEAAGGVLSNYDGSPHDLFQIRAPQSGTLASNGALHDELIAMVRNG